MRIILATALALALAGTAAGCGSDDADDRGKVEVVAAFYPLAEAARQVGGARVEVADLTPAGTEPHDLEPTTDDVDQIEDADLVVIMGRNFQTAIEKVVERRDDDTLSILDALGIPEGSDDPHVWLDPVQMGDVVDAVRDALTDIDPDGAAEYEANAAAYNEKLETLDREYEQGLAGCKSRIIVTAHEAFGWLAKRYDLEEHAIAGIDPEREPDPRHIAELADLVGDEHITTVFTEELLSPKIAEALAREAGVTTAVFDPVESIAKHNQAEGADYLSIMGENLQTLRTALSCS
jgi:zinc transport system substrate-binding protein